MAKLTVGSVITPLSLTKEYDGYASQLLGKYLQTQDRKRGQRRKYSIVAPLPTKEEYEAIKKKRFTITVESLVSDAFADLQSLGDDLNDAVDNLPENLQNSEKAEQKREAADACHNVSEIEVPNSLKDVEILHLPGLDLDSRSDQASEAASKLRSVIAYLEDFIDQEEDKEKKSEADDLMTELESAADDIEAIEFVGW